MFLGRHFKEKVEQVMFKVICLDFAKKLKCKRFNLSWGIQCNRHF
jgi:hypothetical protein